MNGKIYKCRKCNQKTLYVEEKDNIVTGNCTSCGYTFSKDKSKGMGTGILNIFGSLNRFSFIFTIVLIIIMLVSFMTLNEQVRITNLKVDDLDEYLENKIGSINTNITNLRTDINSANTNINSILTRISAAESSISNLNLLYGDISNIRANLTSIDDNISRIWTDVNSLSATNIKDLIDLDETYTFYTNQTGTQRYCHVNLSISHKNIGIKEVRFALRYEKTNISLMNWTGCIKPHEYQWLNGTYNDNYEVYWFGLCENFSAKFNMTWDTSIYNSTNLSMPNSVNTLMVNSVLVSIPVIHVVEV